MTPDIYSRPIPCRLDPPRWPEPCSLPARCRAPAIIEERGGAVVSIEIDPDTGDRVAETCLCGVGNLQTTCDDENHRVDARETFRVEHP